MIKFNPVVQELKILTSEEVDTYYIENGCSFILNR